MRLNMKDLWMSLVFFGIVNVSVVMLAANQLLRTRFKTMFQTQEVSFTKAAMHGTAMSART